MRARYSFAMAMLALVLVTAAAYGQQVPDTTFDTRVARPAHTQRHPRLLFDEAHHNFHTAGGRYHVFAALARNDGFEVIPNTRPFTKTSLAGHDVLVIANALGHEDMGDTAAAHAAFTDAECDSVREWVRAGGALLLIADHAPMGSAARPLAARFGVELTNGYTIDPQLADPKGEEFLLRFTRANGALAEHPITRGRDSTERVSAVKTFAGQSLRGPTGSAVLLALSDQAVDLMIGLGEAGGEVPAEKRQSAAGRAQGLAFTFGKGRVVVLGEAAMMSAQLAGPQQFKMGMNAPGIDNRQFALNTLRWLSGVLE